MIVAANESLSTSSLVIMYFGIVVFSISGALTAARYRMNVIGFILIGTITSIGGGTTRDIILGRTVWWTRHPMELSLCMAAALATFIFIRSDISQRKWMIWSDALGLSAFGMIGCHIALTFGANFWIAVFMGVVTATGGGVIRDVLTNTQPMILCGQLYVSVALLGSLGYATLRYLGTPVTISEFAAFGAAFSLRAAAIVYDIRMGPQGKLLIIGSKQPAPPLERSDLREQ